MRMIAAFIISITSVPGVKIAAWENLTVKCEVTEGSTIVAHCGKFLPPISHLYNFYFIPTNLNPKLETIYLASPIDDTAVFFYLSQETFLKYPELKEIIIKKNYIMHINEEHFTGSEDSSLYKDVFKNLEKLERLEFSDSILDDWQELGLPTNLKVLNVDQNSYTRLYANGSSKLEQLSANDNSLTGLPNFNVPLPSLKKLHLKGNPLANMTIIDLAPLCSLQLLELDFKSNRHFSKPKLVDNDYCECLSVVSWIRDNNISGADNIECKQSSASSKCPEPPKLLEEAKKLREKCLAMIEVPTSSMIYYAIGFIVILLLLLLIVCVILIVRKLSEERSSENVSRASSYWDAEEDYEEEE